MAVSFVPDEAFESYRERFADHFVMTRRDGIIEVRMHQDGATPKWSMELHQAIQQMVHAVGADRQNEVLILTGTGEAWLNEIDNESYERQGGTDARFKEASYETWYLDGTKMLERLLWEVDIPMISAINGPGFHMDIALLADLTICTEDTVFMDPHMAIDLVPGDGQLLIFQQLLGLKRAAALAYLLEGVDARRALELGVVNEVVSRDALLPRAWEMAEKIMQAPRIVRRLTTQVVRRPWKRLFTADFKEHFAHEMYAAHVARAVPNDETLKGNMDLK